jgi:hypothetical protein
MVFVKVYNNFFLKIILKNPIPNFIEKKTM